MQTLGERLEEARKRKGLSIREAAEATKIRGDYLQKFEANSFGLDLPPLYVRGFVRAYARYLDFDPQRFLAEYDSLIAGESRPARRETRENYGRVEFGEAAAEAASPRKGPDPMMLKYGLYGGGALALIIVVIVLINLFGNSSDRPADRGAQQQQSVQNQTPGDNPAAQQLTFTAIEATRIKIVNDSDKTVIYEGALARGETRTFPKNGKLLVTVEKGSNLRMEVNGKQYNVPIENYGRFALD